MFLQSGYDVGLTLRVSRYKLSKWLINYHGIVIYLTALAQLRGTSRSGVSYRSRCRNIIVILVRNPDAAVSRSCPGSRSKSKNHDKLIYFIVRVRWCLFYFNYSISAVCVLKV